MRGQLLPHIGSGAGRSSLAKLILLGELYILRIFLVVLEPYGVLARGLRPPYFLVLTFGKGGCSGPGQAVSALASLVGAWTNYILAELFTKGGCPVLSRPCVRPGFNLVESLASKYVFEQRLQRCGDVEWGADAMA